MSDRSLSRALRWPVWSWRNLGVTVAGVLLLGALVGRLTGGSPEHPERTPGTVAAAGSTSTPAAGTSAAAPGPATASTPPSPTGAASGPVADEARGDAAAGTAA